MGGHGGLNILPQKSWNVYNFENRERVRKDEEAAAREEQERERRDREEEAEIRWQKLKEANAKKAGRQVIGDGEDEKSPEKSVAGNAPSVETEAPRQIKMFGGCVIATSAVAITSANDVKDRRTANLLDWDEFEKDLQGRGESRRDLERNGTEKQGSWRTKDEKSVVERARRELKERIKPVVREADDEHYKLGYGCVENDKKRPWYTLSKSSIMNDDNDVPADGANGRCISEATGKDAGKRKKTLDELRDERLKREQKERERTRKLLFSKADASFGSHIAGRRKYYNSSYGNAR